MARKARMISAPAGGTTQLGQHTSMRLLAGSMGAPTQPMPGDEPLTTEPFEAPVQDDAAWERQVRARELAAGLPTLPSVMERATTAFDFTIGGTRDPGAPIPQSDREAPIPQAVWREVAKLSDLSGLPSTFTLEIEQKPDGTWKVTAPGVHVGLFVADRDLGAALSRAPGVLAEIVRLDGVVAKPKTRRAKA